MIRFYGFHPFTCTYPADYGIASLRLILSMETYVCSGRFIPNSAVSIDLETPKPKVSHYLGYILKAWLASSVKPMANCPLCNAEVFCQRLLRYAAPLHEVFG